MKQCCKCKKFISKKEFRKNKNSRDGLQAMCKECQLEYNRSRIFQPQENPNILKTCTHCEKKKPATLEFFSPKKRNPDGMCHTCKDCRNKNVQKWNNENKQSCADCNKTKPVSTRLQNGDPICADCRKKRKVELCLGCGKIKPVERRLQDGSALCSWCYKKSSLEICSDCKKEKVPNVRLPGGLMRCSECQRRRSPEALFVIYKRGANKRKLDFSLTFEQFKYLITQNCYYCGGQSEISGHLIGIDRVDNDQGYIYDNVVSCCWICNSMKGVLDKEKFLLYVCKIINHHAQPIL